MSIARTLLLVLLLALPQGAWAQDQVLPGRTIRMVVAFPPGGPTDFVGRLITDKMSALLGQRLYIENRAGANGTVGADNVAKSDPDGYSLFLTTAGAVAMSPHSAQLHLPKGLARRSRTACRCDRRLVTMLASLPATLQRIFDADQCADCDPVVEVMCPFFRGLASKSPKTN